MYIRRDLAKIISRLQNEYLVIMLCGSRQVGKSTLLNHIKEDGRKYLTFDDWVSS